MYFGMNKICVCSMLLAIIVLMCSSALACGGFFCEILPINQAGEQIVFRQDGEQVTAMVQIQYAGSAENFAWVLPVPDTPMLSLGSDQIFRELELASRPQFNLTRLGERCPMPIQSSGGVDNGGRGDIGLPGSGDIVIEQTLEVGPFDAQIISSENPDALAQWLFDNSFDLGEQGAALLKPYTDAEMKFVVLKLQSNQSVGDIQPLILKYQSDKPMIPIRLTAIAAQSNMGILVWLLGDSRAVPENYLHVIPNYTRLNWYFGTTAAYASYQNLITDAMNEAGGQGFATDYAGLLPGLAEQLTKPADILGPLNTLLPQDAAIYIRAVWRALNNNSIIRTTLQAALPLPAGSDDSIYTDLELLRLLYSSEMLDTARDTLVNTIQTRIREPLNNALDILDDDLYITRLYTTLSADEMSVDPVFVFNPDMPSQDLTRNATLAMACRNGQTDWNLTLGEGTGRAGEEVLRGQGDPPTVAGVPAVAQEASWQIAQTFASGSPSIKTQRQFDVSSVDNRTDSSGGGALAYLALFYLAGLHLLCWRHRR